MSDAGMRAIQTVHAARTQLAESRRNLFSHLALFLGGLLDNSEEKEGELQDTKRETPVPAPRAEQDQLNEQCYRSIELGAIIQSVLHAFELPLVLEQLRETFRDLASLTAHQLRNHGGPEVRRSRCTRLLLAGI